MSAWKCPQCGHGYDGPQRPCPRCSKPPPPSGKHNKLIRRLRAIARDWPADALLITEISSSDVLTLYDRHPEDGGRPIETFRIRADAIDGEKPNKLP